MANAQMSRMRSFNKHVVNRVTRRFARFPFGPFALIHHIGRRSGKPYETPIMVQQRGNSFLIALTYGPEVDWYRNVQVAGHSTLVWHGRVYSLEQPQPMVATAALPTFPLFERAILHLRGTQHFVQIPFHEVSTSRADREGDNAR